MAACYLIQERIDPNLEVSCSVKPAVYLTVNPVAGVGGAHSGTVELSGARSGCQVVDVHIHNPIPETIEYVTFRNYYTYSITIQFRAKDVSGRVSGINTDPWQLCIRDFQLMPNCHCEQGAQDWVVLSKKQFLNNLDDVTVLRMILKQPSPHWKEFGIQEFRCFQKPKSKPLPPHPGRTGTETQKELESRHNTLEHITANMERLLDIGYRAQTAENLKQQATNGLPSMPPITKDPTLPYEVNLLSYT